MQSAGFWKQSWNIFKRICALPLIALVKFYQLCISRSRPPSCRFTPTCSQYAPRSTAQIRAVEGAVAGSPPAARTVPSVGRQRLRPGTLNPDARKAQMLPGQ